MAFLSHAFILSENSRWHGCSESCNTSKRVSINVRVHFFSLLRLLVRDICLPLFPQPLDFETQKHYNLTVEATNVRYGPNGPFKDTTTVRIAVEDADEPPIFTRPAYTMDVKENAPINTIIGSVTARDPDAVGSSIR